MSLLNYTTTVPVSRSINVIQDLLVKGGARSIVASYDDDGKTTGLAFSVFTEYGIRSFALPVNSDEVLKVLQGDRKLSRTQQTPEHADRVAWRILKDWIEVQLALIQTGMVTLDQVMMPYMLQDGRTVYSLYVESQQTALEAGDVLEVDLDLDNDPTMVPRESE